MRATIAKASDTNATVARLMDQQQYLERETLANFRPIFRREADKAKGEIFPTIWYQSTLEMTSIQQSIMAKSVLVAESPLLKYVDPDAHPVL